MPYLIDGHNLIGALPDIELTDPHDEAKLVLKLRGWAAHHRQRLVIVFDGGVPGGPSRTLSGGPIEVFFAARGHTIADRVIIARCNAWPIPATWTVVSSDHEVLDFARGVGARVLTGRNSPSTGTAVRRSFPGAGSGLSTRKGESAGVSLELLWGMGAGRKAQRWG